jgi:soluble lytic murein transglycosylase-like protein
MARQNNLLPWVIGAAVVAALAVPAGVIVMADWKKKGAKYVPLLNAAEDRHGIPRDLLVRQAYQESRFREDIISGKKRSSAGAVGLMQIIPKWHPSIDPGDAAADERAALDPARAADYAAKFMAQLKKQFGTWSLALAAYNAGPGNVNKYKGIPPFEETRNYVTQIMDDWQAAGGRIV